MFRNASFRNDYKFFRAGAADGADEIVGELFALDGENAVVTAVGFHGTSSSRLTVSAQTGEGYLAGVDPAAGGFLYLRIQGFGNMDLVQVQDGVAAFADEVDMVPGVGIKSLDAVYGGHAGYQTLLLEVIQIPVDRGQGDVRMGLLEHLVDHFRRRVAVGLLQTFQNGIALSELLGGWFHGHLSFVVFASDYHLRTYSSTGIWVCQEENENYSHLFF